VQFAGDRRAYTAAKAGFIVQRLADAAHGRVAARTAPAQCPPNARTAVATAPGRSTCPDTRSSQIQLRETWRSGSRRRPVPSVPALLTTPTAFHLLAILHTMTADSGKRTF
jgi:hypothetical protein